jgi:hypothetical protein
MYLNHGSMELAYKDYSVRIVHNPSDIIVRFTDAKTMRLWQVVYTERDFVEYQVLGGLEFVASLLKDALKSEVYEISDFKVTSKQLSFTIQYAPDEHCKQINIEFLLPAIKKETANVDMESVSNRIALLEKALAELVPLQKEVAQQKDKITSLTQDLEIQKEKSAGYIVLPGCPYSIYEDTQTLHLGLTNCTSPINSVTYNSSSFSQSKLAGYYIFDSLNNLNNVKYLRKCETFSITNPTTKDFSPIGHMTSLKNLHIAFTSASTALVDISWIEKLTNLESVIFYNCKCLTNITSLLFLKKLKSIDIRGSNVQNTSLFGTHITISR